MVRPAWPLAMCCLVVSAVASPLTKADDAGAEERYFVQASLFVPHNHLAGGPWTIEPTARDEAMEVMGRRLPALDDSTRNVVVAELIRRVSGRTIACVSPTLKRASESGPTYPWELTYAELLQSRTESAAAPRVGDVLRSFISASSEIGRAVKIDVAGFPNPPDAPETAVVDVVLLTRDHIVILAVPIRDEPAAEDDEPAPAEPAQRGLFDAVGD